MSKLTDAPYTVVANFTTHRYVCGCGASCDIRGKDVHRFIRRHPSLCNKKRAFAKQLAEGVRSVETEKEEGEE